MLPVPPTFTKKYKIETFKNIEIKIKNVLDKKAQ